MTKRGTADTVRFRLRAGGHVRLYTVQVEGVISPRLDTTIVNLFLRPLSVTLEPDVRTVPA